MSILSTFQFNNENPVRIVYIKNEPWFVAQDVMTALEYAESSKPSKVMGHLPEKWKGVKRLHTPGGEQQVSIISEQGLYFFLGRSDKPKALPFQMWYAGEVIPSIRKTGTYSTTINKEQLFQLKTAANIYAERNKQEIKSVYNDFYKKFRVKRYQDLPAKRYRSAIRHFQVQPPKLKNEFDIFFKFNKGKNAQYVVTITDGQADIKQLAYGRPNGEYGKPVDVNNIQR